MIGDGPGYHIGKKCDVEAVVEKIIAIPSPAVDVRQPGNLHEGVKADAEGKQKIKPLNICLEKDIDVFQKKITVFKKA
jgi:hypothetical protein